MSNGKQGQAVQDSLPRTSTPLAHQDQLLAECNKAFKKTCTALRLRNGTKKCKTSVCNNFGRDAVIRQKCRCVQWRGGMPARQGRVRPIGRYEGRS